jgi:hypothetical protein
MTQLDSFAGGCQAPGPVIWERPDGSEFLSQHPYRTLIPRCFQVARFIGYHRLRFPKLDGAGNLGCDSLARAQRTAGVMDSRECISFMGDAG